MSTNIYEQINHFLENISNGYTPSVWHFLFLIFFIMIGCAIKYRNFSPNGLPLAGSLHSADDFHDSWNVINPATGLPMMGGVDAGGNCFGFSSSSSINDDYRSSHDPHHH